MLSVLQCPQPGFLIASKSLLFIPLTLGVTNEQENAASFTHGQTTSDACGFSVFPPSLPFTLLLYSLPNLPSTETEPCALLKDNKPKTVILRFS